MKTHNSLICTTALELILLTGLTPKLQGQNVNMQWVQRYDYCDTCIQQINEAQSIGLDKNQNVYVGGYSQQVDNDMNWAVVKYSSAGVFLWQARYGGAAGGFDALYDMKVDYNTGDVYATGKSIESGSVYSIYTTIKYNRNGIQQWVAHYNGYQSTAWAINIDSQGNSYVTGSSNEGPETIATVKYNSSGIQQWVARYSSGTYQSGKGVIVDSGGNVYVTGYTGTTADSYSHYVTIKYNSQGVEQWHQLYGGSSIPAAITVDPLGNAYVTGATFSGYYPHGYLTIKYDTMGNQMWVSTFEGAGNGQDDARAMVYDPNTNSVVVTGGSFDSVTTASYTTIKYDAISGGAVWTAHYFGLANFGGGNAIAADASGNIYVTGGSVEGGIGYDYATVKYNRNGVQRWAVTYDGGFGNDYGLAIALGTSGDVYVTGASGNSAGYSDYATVKYSQN